MTAIRQHVASSVLSEAEFDNIFAYIYTVWQQLQYVSHLTQSPADSQLAKYWYFGLISCLPDQVVTQALSSCEPGHFALTMNNDAKLGFIYIHYVAKNKEGTQVLTDRLALFMLSVGYSVLYHPPTGIFFPSLDSFVMAQLALVKVGLTAPTNSGTAISDFVATNGFMQKTNPFTFLPKGDAFSV